AAELDLNAAQAAFQRAAELAEALDDDRALAAATRELGCIQVGWVRGWFVEQVQSGQHIGLMARAVQGEALDDIVGSLPVASNAEAASVLLKRALELFEKVGDRRGVMS